MKAESHAMGWREEGVTVERKAERPRHCVTDPAASPHLPPAAAAHVFTMPRVGREVDMGTQSAGRRADQRPGSPAPAWKASPIPSGSASA